LKNWEGLAVIGIFSFVVGLIVVAWGFQAAEPIKIEQIGNVMTASLDPTFILLFMVGMFAIGLGVGDLASVYIVYKLEKSKGTIQGVSEKYCAFCGQKLQAEAAYCPKCGKKTT
jgi:lipopolysaccharide export LptBFGC system permease protein LptF